jgi:hypothetical protein
MNKPKPTATSRRSVISKGGHDGRTGIKGTAGTFTTASRKGVSLPNEDIRETLTIEQYRRESR